MMGDRAVLSALIVDDEAPARAELRFQLEQIPAVRVVGEAATAKEALELIEAVGHDVVFLDVALPGPDGLVLAEQLRRTAPEPAIVFVTAYDGYAVDAFRLEAADYLLKPVVPERLAAAVSRVRGRRASAAGQVSPSPPRRFVAGHVEGRTVPVALSDVLYCETVDKHVEMVAVGGQRYLVEPFLTSVRL